jgi:epoxide hydrolase-like predicted phosphatase
MIKGLLFDYDGVMTAQSMANNPSDLLAKVLGMSSEEVGTLFMSFWPDYLRGTISDEELWPLIEAKSGKTIPSEQRNIWTRWEQLKPRPQMVEFVAKLRADGYQVGLLTNVTPTTEDEVRTHGGYDGFDFLVQSCKVGYAKPDPEIYELAIQQFVDITSEETLFVDDREHCLVPARELGIQTVLALNAEQVIADINTRLLS